MKKVLVTVLVALLALSLFAQGSKESEVKEEKVKIGTIATVYGTASFNDDILDGIKYKLNIDGVDMHLSNLLYTSFFLRILISTPFSFSPPLSSSPQPLFSPHHSSVEW